jgi:uncharacterized protein (DUF2252 family)
VQDVVSASPPGGDAEEERMAKTAAAASKPVSRVQHLTPEERAALGKAARAEVPRASHGEWTAATDRRDPIEILEAQAATRVPELVPVRYGRMLVSPFTFYRGAAAVMAADLNGTPRSGITTQVCGDAHLSNFGVFATPERQMVFDINDFDETLPGPWEWDVKRLAASLAIAGRNNGFTDAERADGERAAVGEYRSAMWEFARMGNLDVWYSTLPVQEGLPQVRAAMGRKDWKAAEQAVEKAKTRDNLQAFSKLTHEVDGERRIISDPPLVVPIEELFPEADAKLVVQGIHALIRRYRRTLLGDRRRLLEDFRFEHIARKVVGVGSVGTRAWIILFTGRDGYDPLFLQAKEAQPSVLEPYVGKSPYANAGQRVVEGQRLMQASSDIFLGWDRAQGPDGLERDFYVRQLRDWKGSVPPEAMTPSAMNFYGRICARALARAHARSGDRIAIASYLGKNDAFDRAIATFSERYADQNERDHAALKKAVKAKRIVAKTGV